MAKYDYAKHREYQKEYHKSWYAKLKAEGRCVMCQKPLGDDPHCYCEKCREHQRRITNMRYHERKAAAIREL